MKKVINLKNLLFCAMLALSIALSTVSAQAAPLDNLGNTVDGSVLTNETEASTVLPKCGKKYIFTSRI